MMRLESQVKEDRCRHWHFKCYPTLVPKNGEHKFELIELETDHPFTPSGNVLLETNSLSEMKLLAAIRYGIATDDINWWSVDSEKCKADIAEMRASGEISI